MNKSWKDEIIDVLKELGGEGHLSDIYELIEKRGQMAITPSFKNTVRDAIERFSKDSVKGKTDIFYSVEGLGSGIWGLNNYEPEDKKCHITEDDVNFPEGAEKLKLHICKERNPKVIRLAKEKFKDKNGKLFCQVCSFEFSKMYGEIGKDYIEGHHIIPIKDLKPGTLTKVEDIVLVCSNCHRMLHRKRPCLEISKLNELLIK